MKKLLIGLLLLLSICAHAQIPALNDIVRTNTLTPAKVANALDGSKSVTASGTNTYTISTGFNPYLGSATYATGDMFTVTFTNSNTSGTCSVNIDSEGAISLKGDDGNDLDVSSIPAGGTRKIRYNGTHFRVVGASGSGGGAVSSVFGRTGAVTAVSGDYDVTEVDGALQSVSGDGVDNTDPLNPVMDLSGYTPNITTFNSQSADYTFQLTDGDGNTEVQLTGSTGRNFTIPPNASVAFPVGTIIYASRQGSGVFTWVAGAGVTLLSTKGDLVDPGQYVLMAAKKEATNTWKVYNGLSFALSSGDVTSALGYTPVPPTRTIAGVDLADNITQDEAITALDGWHRVTITSDVVFASTSYGDITNLLFPVTANVRAEFRAWIYVDAANSSEGWTSSFTGPTLTSTRYLHSGFAATNGIVTHLSTSYDETAALLSASTTSSMGELAGRVLTSASGNIQFRMKTETGGINITVKAGSYVEYRVVGVNN